MQGRGNYMSKCPEDGKCWKSNCDKIKRQIEVVRERGREERAERQRKESFLGVHHRWVKNTVEIQLHDNEGAQIFQEFDPL